MKVPGLNKVRRQGFKVPGLSIKRTAGFEGTRSYKALGGPQGLKVPGPKKHGTYRGRLNSHVFFSLGWSIEDDSLREGGSVTAPPPPR